MAGAEGQVMVRRVLLRPGWILLNFALLRDPNVLQRRQPRRPEHRQRNGVLREPRRVASSVDEPAVGQAFGEITSNGFFAAGSIIWMHVRCDGLPSSPGTNGTHRDHVGFPP